MYIESDEKKSYNIKYISISKYEEGKYPNVNFSVDLQRYRNIGTVTVVLYQNGKEYLNTNTTISFADKNTVSFNFKKVKISSDETTFDIYYYYDSQDGQHMKTKVDSITVKITTNTSSMDSNDDEVVVL